MRSLTLTISFALLAICVSAFPLMELRRADQIVDHPALESLGLAHPPNAEPAPPAGINKDLATRPGSQRAPEVQPRATDERTAGGNAHSGNTGDVDSGNVNNIAGPDSTITNFGGNDVPQAGETVSGDATGGAGRFIGPGGNASTGDTGTADGGYVNNDAGIINNMGAGENNAGDGGVSRSGVATGGTSY